MVTEPMMQFVIQSTLVIPAHAWNQQLKWHDQFAASMYVWLHAKI